jgi:hypothetical protein
MLRRIGVAARRFALVLITGAALGGAAVVVAPGAGAATGTLTVTTLDRTGHSVRSQFGVVDVNSGYESYFFTGAARRLAVGTYDVFAAIASPTAGDTVGVRRIRVSGAAHLTIDARKGQPVRGFLNPAPPPGFLRHTEVWLCTADGSVVAGGGSTSGPAYVIPSTLTDVEFAFSSIWSAQDFDNHRATYYAGAAVYRHGAPTGMTKTFLQSNLTNLSIRGRTGLQTAEAQIDVRNDATDRCRQVSLQLFAQATLPYTLTMHVPGGQWLVSQFAQDSISGPVRQYQAQHSYTLTVGGAAWGPAGHFPIVDQYCHCLLAASSGPMFADPSLPSGAGSRVNYTLSKGGTILAHRTIDPDLNGFVPTLPTSGWYSLTAVGVRNPINPLPGNVLSPRVALRMHFYADRNRDMEVGGYGTRFVPRELSVANRARTATTNISVQPLRAPGQGTHYAVKSVSVWMSADTGHTWHLVHVRHMSGKWAVTVTNPASGYVSLRGKVVDTFGNTATTTILRAYAVE